jgi:glycosyltransferase involved in cell wall biosynthesis
MENLVSVIIPNRNGATTIGKCLEAALASRHVNFEVIVVDDNSEDHSVSVIAQYPCKLLQLSKHGGAAVARNLGVQHARGAILFFTDADCLLQDDTLTLAVATLAAEGPGAIVGGTYTVAPYDRRFCSRFQSVFIHYFETRHAPAADYIATHALAMDADSFRRHRGFAQGPLPILEDVEFSHRLRRAGCRLVMNPAIQVQHIFNYSLLRSLRNAFTKSMYWTGYAIGNRDLLADSGTASVGLKVNACMYVFNGLLLPGYFLSAKTELLVLLSVALAFNLFVNRGLLLAFQRAEGLGFAVRAALYYLLLYPVAVAAGAGAGLMLYIRSPGQFRGNADDGRTNEVGLH